MTLSLKHFSNRRLYCHGGIKMNLAFALNTYNQTKVSKEAAKYDGYEAVKFALEQVITSMEKLNSNLPIIEKEYHFERSLSCIYFLQKCLDFESGGELAKNLFKVYEYCRSQIISISLKGASDSLESAIEFIKTILEGWNGMQKA